jgi:hypothetical protein
MNLLTDETDSMPEGGWELIRLERSNFWTMNGASDNGPLE